MQTLTISIKDEPHWHVKLHDGCLYYDLEALSEKEASEVYLKVKRFMEEDHDHPEFKLAGALAFEIEPGGHIKTFSLLLEPPAATGVCPAP